MASTHKQDFDLRLYKRACDIIDKAREDAYRHINYELVLRNWRLGKLISEDDLNGKDRAEYGLGIIQSLSESLTESYGRGFSRRDLYNYISFYRTNTTLFIATTHGDTIVYSLSAQSSGLLSWTHYRTLLQISDKAEREWYENEARNQTWSVRTLQRNISSQYYRRLLSS